MDTPLPSPTKPIPCRDDDHTRPDIPEFRRLRYQYGQMLGATDFQAEQDYHRDKQRLHNRCLHGYGVICGMLVHPAADPATCEPAGVAEARAVRAELADLETQRGTATGDDLRQIDARIAMLVQRCKHLPNPDCTPLPPTRITIDCGMALDCQGNDLVLRRPLTFDPWIMLAAADRKRMEDQDVTLYISICFCEQGIDPIRPVLSDPCGTPAVCSYGKLRETVQVVVSLTEPEEDRRCETCCSTCADCCLLLARIDCYRPGKQLDPDAVHNEIRRRLASADRPPTVITGINWVHGAEYSKVKGEQLLGTEDEDCGIVIHFSRPVLASTLQRGVIDLWRLEGGGGRSGYLTEVRGIFMNLPSGGTVTSIRYRQIDEEDLDGGDRILIQVRCAFILDECCRPVDGAHVGGRVPPLPDAIWPENYQPPTDCVIPPWGYLPWTSGNGTPGSGFESWFTIAQHEHRNRGGGYRPKPESDR
jgi:hypothetical protein